jgi:hypothetical protein
MSKRARVLAVVSSLLALAALPAAAAAFNHAKFDLVIEGDATAERTFQLTGQASICEEDLHGKFEQTTRFLRGKGVTIEFVRKKLGAGWEYGARRLSAASAITVVATSKRTATGEQTLKRVVNAPAPVQCPEEGTKQLSGLGECGVAKATRDDVGLKVTGNSFAIVEGENLAAPVSKKNVCGETPLDAGFIEMHYEWPDYFPVEVEPIPDAKLFSAARAVKVDLESLGQPGGVVTSVGGYPLTGTATDKGDTKITVRFIRCGVKHYPAC